MWASSMLIGLECPVIVTFETSMCFLILAYPSKFLTRRPNIWFVTAQENIETSHQTRRSDSVGKYFFPLLIFLIAVQSVVVVINFSGYAEGKRFAASIFRA